MKRTKELTTNKGITLIALIITIIVMLLLVGVTISMAINGGLFEQAGKAASETNKALKEEQLLADGRIKIGETLYNNIDEYIDNISSSSDTVVEYSKTPKDSNGLLKANAIFESDGYTAIVPKGFKIINGTEGSTSIAKGLVIQDINKNEFVWVPVTEDLLVEGTDTEPLSLTGIWEESSLDTKPEFDSQAILDELYGPNYYTYTDDMYEKEYAQMVESVNKNNGFYIGRYETTIDNQGKIGSKYNTTVLTATLYTEDGSEIDYEYRWYGLYNEQKTADITGNASNVQTAMIYGILWDKTMDFIRQQKIAGNTNYDVDSIMMEEWHGGDVAKSGQKTLEIEEWFEEEIIKDVALNIWDLETNVYEWTQEAGLVSYEDYIYDPEEDISYPITREYYGNRVMRGGGPDISSAPASDKSYGWSRTHILDDSDPDHYYGSRLCMYVK